MGTKIMPVSDFRRKASEILTALREGGDVVYITQHGRPAAVLVDYDRYEAMIEELEDLADVAAIEAAADEPSRDYEQFLAEVNKQPKQ